MIALAPFGMLLEGGLYVGSSIFCILGNGNYIVEFNEMDISTFFKIHVNM